jgi:NADPH-dependent 2,4-dienoyl-CoA reductase/sulfur reductase-like enzyme
MRIVIIGGVAGGATAAARMRRADEFAEIILLEKGKYMSYANCGLPYYIGGVIDDRDKLFVQTPEAFGKRFNVDVRVENEALAIDTDAKTVTVRDAKGSEYSLNYDKLLLSPGASPVRPPLPGIDSEGIFTLRNVTDTDAIKGYLTSHNVRDAVIVGAGFIGLEMADNLHHAGAHVSIVEMADQVMAPVDYSTASYVHQHLLQKGVSLFLKQGVEHFERHEDKIHVFFNSGKSIVTDMVVLVDRSAPGDCSRTEGRA